MINLVLKTSSFARPQMNALLLFLILWTKWMRVFILVHLVIILRFHRCQCGLSDGDGASKGGTLRASVAKQEAPKPENSASTTINDVTRYEENANGDTTEPSALGETLDLQILDSSLALVDEETHNGMSSKCYIVTNKTFGSLSENGVDIWKEDKGDKLIALNIHSNKNSCILNICTKKSHKLAVAYFEKSTNGWNNLEEWKFDEGYERMRNVPVPGITKKEETNPPPSSPVGGQNVASRIKRNGGTTKNANVPEHAFNKLGELVNVDPNFNTEWTTGAVLDLSNPDKSRYKVFYYVFLNNAIKLIVARKGVFVSKLMNDESTIWEAQPEETLEYCKAYLNKYGQPELVHLVLRTFGAIRDHYMELKNEHWKPCNSHNYKMDTLKVYSARNKLFTLDLSTASYTNECTVFEVENFGIITRQFYPKLGYVIRHIKDGNKYIWTIPSQYYDYDPGNYTERCLSCIIYRRGTVELLEVALVINYLRRRKHYEKVNGRWNEITLVKFNEKLNLQIDFGCTTLEISNPDPVAIDTVTRRPYEILTKVHSARDGHTISSVMEYGREICKVQSGHSCEYVLVVRFKETNYDSTKIVDRLVTVYTLDSSGRKNAFYYQKVGFIWSLTTEDAFYRRFHIETLRQSELTAVTLDIKGNNDPAKFFVNKSPDFPFTAYAPNVGYRIKTVKDGIIVWRIKIEDGGFLYISFYPKDDPKVSYIVVHTSQGMKELFYSRTSGSWTGVKKHTYLSDLKEAGFDKIDYSNEITADLSKSNRRSFHIIARKIDNYGVDMYTPPVGLKFKTIVDRKTVVWKASRDERCTYMNAVHINGSIFAFFILVEDPNNGRSVLYFVKRDDEWSRVEKSEYHALMPVRVNSLELPKMENQKIIMSSFRNKDGLKIITYSSEVDNAKGDIILCHGVRSHFMSEFGTSNVEWNFEHYGSPVSLDIDGIFLQEHKGNGINTTDIHRHIFEHTCLDGMDASLVQPAYEYEGSFIEFLNKLGYNVYGLDLQSHGLSEAQTENKCFVEDFKDYVHDLLQFVSIIKRGVFHDPGEEWDGLVYEPHPTNGKLFLLGNSMGGNIVMQAVQEFYRHAEKGAKFIDTLIVTAGMFNIDHYLDDLSKKVAKSLLSIFTENALAKTNVYEVPLNYGEAFDLFIRYKDPFFNTNRLTFKATKLAFDACADVNKDENMAHFPKDLPTLVFHSRDDFMCDVKGPKEMMETYFEYSENVKFIELGGSVHYLTIPQAMIPLQSYFKDWLEQHT